MKESPVRRTLRDMTRCNLGKFLVVPTFVTRRLQVRKDARDPSGESWNYLSRIRSSNFAVMTASKPFMDVFHATNIRQVDESHCYKCVFKTWLAANHKETVIILALKIICAAFQFVISIAPTEDIRVLALHLSLSLQIMVSSYYLNQLSKDFYDVLHVS